MAVKIELLQARMGDATLHTKRVTELEARLKDREARERELLDGLERSAKELQQAEQERERYKALAARGAAAATTPAEGDEKEQPGREKTVATTARQMAELRGEIESLRAAVRYLREERRARMVKEREKDGAPRWLELPDLLPGRTKEQEGLGLRQGEQAAVLRALVKRVGSVQVAGWSGFSEQQRQRQTERKGKWRPRKETSAWRMVGVREEWDGWRGWMGEVLQEGTCV
jgi:dynactin 1